MVGKNAVSQYVPIKDHYLIGLGRIWGICILANIPNEPNSESLFEKHLKKRAELRALDSSIVSAIPQRL